MSNYQIFFLSIVLFVNFLFFYNLSRIAKTINIFDFPDNNRKIHKGKIPVLGGLLIIFNIILIVLFLNKQILNFEVYKNVILINSYYFIFTFFFSLLFLFFIGIIDDKYSIKPFIKILSFFFIYFILVFFDESLHIKYLKFSFLDFDISLRKSGILLAIICLVFAVISQNMFDGANLQTGGLYLFICIFFIYNKIALDLFLIIFFSLLFFLYYNSKNKIFLGDSGVYVLSFLTSFYFIKSYNMNLGPKYLDEVFSYLFLPSVDCVRVGVQRVYFGKNPFMPDRTHFHHILLRKYSANSSCVVIILLLLTPFIWINFLQLSVICLILLQFISYFLFLYISRKK